jgi:hypothetical protein
MCLLEATVAVYQVPAPQQSSNFPHGPVHAPGSVSTTRDIWKQILDFNVSPPYLLWIFSINSFHSDFLETLDDGLFFSPPTMVGLSLVSTTPFATSLPLTQNNTTPLVLATKTKKTDNC